MQSPKRHNPIRSLFHRLLVVGGSVVVTLAFFLVLPLMQVIGDKVNHDLEVRSASVAAPPPPPPPPEPDKPDPPEKKPPPPKLTVDAPPPDLSDIELALGDGIGDGWMPGGAAFNINSLVGQGGNLDELFNMADLDQKPRVVYQPGPMIDKKMKRRAPGTVYVIFIVDQRGRVESPKVQNSTDPVFNRAALAAVKKWKFEPGKKNGKAVRFRMRVPITFPKG